MKGTFVNVAAVIAGSCVGLIFHSRFPEKIEKTAFNAIGLFTVFLGVKMALGTQNLLVMVFSLLLGGITGELMKIDQLIERFSNWIKTTLKMKNERFTEGLITAFLLFCMGSMTILGAFEEGISSKPDLLYAKSVLDGFASIALSASLGIGVLFSVIPLLIFQGGLTLFAGVLSNILSEAIIVEITAVGGILLLGLGFNILKVKDIKIINMLPALLFVVLLMFAIG